MSDFLVALSPSRFRSDLTRTRTMARVGSVLVLALVLCASGSRSAHLLPGAEVNCSQQGLSCSFSHSNCLDPNWTQSHQYTPSGPDQMDLRISTRRDPNGNLLPVLEVNWTLKDDGSISFLKATELHVLVASTNQNLCARYSFRDQLPMRNPAGNQWQFSADMVVVEPGQKYRVSVENIPKPELDHSSYSVSRDVSVPDCEDSLMRWTQPCIESGVLWRPNISVSQSGGSILRVQFSPDPLSEHYSVLCRCGRISNALRANKGNSSRLSASFNLGFWVRSCCRFDVEIKPYFSHCGNDCERRRSTIDICQKVVPADPWNPLPLVLGVSSVLLLFVVLGVCGAIICRGRGRKPRPGLGEEDRLVETKLEDHPRLLLIYSQDHPLYRDVVLKLCAFLQAQCGIVVLLDLLDSFSVAQVGLVRWLELQRQKLRPSDKILVLCSRGVQAKWRAMCGQGQTVHQPDDLIGPFLSLFLSDMHRPGAMGRYVAAYFEEFGSEMDVPSFFDIAVKYKLMKHFEELYFRVRDMEKYEPLKVNHVEGIGRDEYFRCDTGLALKNAIETFQAFQIENPDWFEKAAADAEEDAAVTEASLFISKVDVPPIVEFVPIVREDLAIYANDVSVNENLENFYVITPESNPLNQMSIAEFQPVLNPDAASPSQSIFELEPVPRPNLEILASDIAPIQVWVESHSEEEEEEVSLLSDGRIPAAVVVFPELQASSEIPSRRSEPVEMDEFEEFEDLEELDGRYKGPNSGSDQGYSSKVSTEMDSEDMKALLRLQQELMQGICPFERE